MQEQHALLAFPSRIPSGGMCPAWAALAPRALRLQFCQQPSGLLTSPFFACLQGPQSQRLPVLGWFSCPNFVGSKVGWRRGCGHLPFQGCLSSAPHPIRTHVHAPHTHACVRSHMHSRTPACTPMMLPQKASKSGPSLSSRNSDESGRCCVFMPARGLFPPPNQK